MLSLWTDDVSPIYPAARAANRFRFRMDSRDITRRSSSSNCCFLNLKYSSIRYLIRYTFATIWHSRFFSCIFILLKSSIGSAPNSNFSVIIRFVLFLFLLWSADVKLVLTSLAAKFIPLPACDKGFLTPLAWYDVLCSAAFLRFRPQISDGFLKT